MSIGATSPDQVVADRHVAQVWDEEWSD